MNEKFVLYPHTIIFNFISFQKIKLNVLKKHSQTNTKSIFKRIKNPPFGHNFKTGLQWHTRPNKTRSESHLLSRGSNRNSFNIWSWLLGQIYEMHKLRNLRHPSLPSHFPLCSQFVWLRPGSHPWISNTS